jgi:DNA-directed RNA polymerase subunit RPC12/RpoP
VHPTLKGKRLYVCASCKAEEFVHWTALNRAAILRCGSCGSTAMDPKTEEAKQERAIGSTVYVHRNEFAGDATNEATNARELKKRKWKDRNIVE